MAPHKLLNLIFLLLAVKLSQQGPIFTKDVAAKEDYRLDNDVKPENYKIDLTLPNDFHQSKTFYAVVEITIKPEDLDSFKETITLNAKNLTVDKDKVTLYEETDTNKKNMLDLTRIQEEPLLDRIVFTLLQGNTFEKTETYRLIVPYLGTLHEDMYGVYLSSYKLDSGDTEWLVATQFQPTHARRAFPCFDEPEFKATFDISITHPKEYSSLSNAKVLRTEDTIQDATTTIFETTPRMSTYIVALAVSKFEKLEKVDDTLVGNNRAWTRNGLKSNAEYSHDIAPIIVEKLNEVTKIPYMNYMTKLDQIAIPDFSAGAMENWGLITYRENALLWDKDESTTKSKQSVASTVAHELAHMWFGNLVTCSWWSAIWLNEGFASYFEYVVMNEVESDWKMDKQIVIEQQRPVFISDALLTSRPLTSNKGDTLTPSQIISKFDSIAYSKGGSVIRMMNNFLGEDIFLKGIQNYLDAHKLKTATPDDLWAAFNDIEGIKDKLPPQKKLIHVMKTWSEQAGFPVVKVDVDESTKGVKLTQKRFFSHEVEQADPTSWYIPITYITHKDQNTSNGWLIPNQELEIKNITEDSASWILINIKDTGYYRVNYGTGLWYALINNALNEENFNKIDVLNKAQLVDDALNLARAGQLPYDVAFDVASYLVRETDYFPWYSSLRAFSYLLQRLDPTSETANLLNPFIRSLMTKFYNSVSFDKDESTQVGKHKKVLALNWGCKLGEESCIENSKELFKSFRAGKAKINPDLRSIVYCNALRHSEGSDDWDFLWKRFGEIQVASEIGIIISALGCTRDKKKLNEYLQHSISSTSGIRKQDTSAVYSAVINGNPEGVPVALKFLIENLETILDMYGGLNAVSSVISVTGDKLTTESQIEELRKLIEENQDVLGDVGNSAVEQATENLLWVQKYQDEILQYLKDATSTTKASTVSTVQQTTTTTESGTTKEPINTTTKKSPTTTTVKPTAGPTKEPITTPTAAPTTADPPPSTTPGGATSATICSTILILSIIKAMVRM